tara:strand:+ start:29590 stop:32259 length:2670 start_codon:yes stop_codon:yes gene_type:complete
MRITKSVLFLIVVSLILVNGIKVSEVNTTGKITGQVIEAETGETLPGATVSIVGTQQGAVTDADGYYIILNVSPGTYELKASFLGFKTQIVQEVRVKINQTTTIDFTMSESVTQGEEVVVIAKRPIVQRDLTSSKASISSKEMQIMPVENFNDVVNLQAGVVEGHFRGGRLGEVAYLVDGIPINDSFDNSFAYQVENNSIQEVEVISGTFNAEFGQAQSGVVNIVTKNGGEDYEGNFSMYSGDYITTRNGVFQNSSSISPLDIYDVQGSLSGPVPGFNNKLNFFMSGRTVNDDGYLYGQNIVRPIYDGKESVETVIVDGREVLVGQLGDSSYSSMNWSKQNTVQLKLTSSHIKGNKLSVTGLYQNDEGQGYNHLYSYNPDGTPTNYGESISLNVVNNYLISNKTFINLKGAYFINRSKSYVYEDPLDPRYPRDNPESDLGGNFAFLGGGAIMDHTNRETGTLLTGFDITSQVNRQNMIKAGGLVKFYTIEFRTFEVLNNSSTGFEPAIPPEGTPNHVYFDERPTEISAYIQDKMEFDYMVVNLGIRFDYFDANSTFPSDYGRPTTSEKTNTSSNWQLSPRFGIAYPISESGVVHVSYGYFFQVPSFQFLYINPDYTYNPEVGLSRVFGNPDLKPQQTVSYEIGLQQGFQDILSLQVTAFYKDIRNLLGTRIETIQTGFDEPFPLSKYGRYINTDYGQTKGLILNVEKRMQNNFSFNINYSFQVASGNASDPRARALDELAGVQTEKQLVPLDWDRRHQLNASTSFLTKSNWVLTVLGEYGSGFPYTPSKANERIGLVNSDRKPTYVNFDMYASKSFTIKGTNASVFARIYNLFDTQNETQVYNDTGRAFPNLQYQTGIPQGLNTKDEFLFRPDFYSAPRRVTIGLNLSF